MGYPSTGLPPLATSVRSIEVDQSGSFALRGKTYTYVLSLAAGVGQSVTVPAYTDAAGATWHASQVLLAGNGDFWVNYDIALSAVPAANITDGTAPEFKPTFRLITDVTTINLIAPQNCLVSMMFFQG